MKKIINQTLNWKEQSFRYAKNVSKSKSYKNQLFDKHFSFFLNKKIRNMLDVGCGNGDFLNNFLKNKKISVTKCEQKWDFIYSRDVISSTKFLAENKDSKGVYNLGSGLSLNLKEVVLKIKKLTKSSSIINFGGLNYNKNQTMYLLADISKILDLGWKYKPNFNRDIKRLIKYYKK